MDQVTAEQVAAEYARLASEAVLAAAPVALDTWRLICEALQGQVAVVMRFGWDEPQARAMVCSQFIANALSSR